MLDNVTSTGNTGKAQGRAWAIFTGIARQQEQKNVLEGEKRKANCESSHDLYDLESLGIHTFPKAQDAHALPDQEHKQVQTALLKTALPPAPFPCI